MSHDEKAVRDDRFFLVVRLAAVFSVMIAFSVAAFIALGALPAIKEQGIRSLFGFLWQPQRGIYGITAMLLSSLAAAIVSASTAFLIASLAAAWLGEKAPHAVLRAANRLCSVMSGIPSIIFGLWGLVTIIPLLQRLSPEKSAESGGASFVAAVAVLIILQMPFMLPESLDALKSSAKFDAASAALGADKMQTLFRSRFFHSRGRFCAILLAGIRRSFCETMAVQFVSGNIVSLPRFFGSVRLLGAGLMLEMGYAQGIHRSALFFIGFVMLAVALLTELFSPKK